MLVLAAFVGWAWPQILAALPTGAALIILIRYVLRGNRTVPATGLALFAVNVVASFAFLWYLSTLPFYFR